MTSNQIAYQKNLIEERRNQEVARHNLAEESTLPSQIRLNNQQAIETAIRGAKEDTQTTTEFGNMIANIIKGIGSIIPF